MIIIPDVSEQDSFYDYICYNKMTKFRHRIVVTDQTADNFVILDHKITIKKQEGMCHYHQLFNVSQQ